VGGEGDSILHNDDSREIDIELGPGFSLEISVRDPQGNPLRDAETEIICTSLDGGYCRWPLHSWVPEAEDGNLKTDENGRVTWHGFHARLGPGERHVVSVCHARYAEHLVQRPEDLPRQAGLAKVEVQLQEGVSLAGCVRDARDRSPLVGAVVEALWQDRTNLVPCCHAIRKSVISDEAGHYHLCGLLPGRHRVYVSHPERVAHVAEEVRVEEKEAQLDFELREGIRVAGRVVDAEGRPVPRAVVCASWSERFGAGKDSVTDAEGRFVIHGLPADTDLCVRASSANGQHVHGCCTVRGAQSEIAFDERLFATLKGRLVDEETGQPIGQRVEWVAYRRPHLDFIGDGCSPGAEGTFEIRLPAGSLLVRLRAERRFFGVYETELAAGEVREGLTIPAQAGRSLKVRVLDERTQRPIAQALIRLRDETRVWRAAFFGETREDGALTFRGLPPATFAVQASAGGYTTVLLRGMEAAATEKERVVHMAPQREEIKT
jgi:protocatechuate 3,4-dioxygenase beta subunit